MRMLTAVAMLSVNVWAITYTFSMIGMYNDDDI